MYPTASYGISSVFTPVATPNNLVIIEGSSSKTIKVWAMWIFTQATAAGSAQFFLKKYSTAHSGGVFVSAGTPVPLDSADGAATVNKVGHFSTDPTPGTLVGIIRNVSFAVPVLRAATPAGIVELSGIEMIAGSQNGIATGVNCAVTLRGVGEYLAIDFNDVALISGQVHQYSVMWTEE